MKWIVLVQPNAMTERTYGPFGSPALAGKFAEFVTATIGGPATVLPLLLPEWELLVHWERTQGRDAFEEAVDQMVAGGLLTDLKKTAPAATTAGADPALPNG